MPRSEADGRVNLHARAVGLPAGVELDQVIRVLRASAARFAYVFGSRAEGGVVDARADLDVAAWFGRPVDATDPSVVAGLPGAVDLLVLDDAPLELAGHVATRGLLIFDDDPPARVRWEAITRKIYLDEAPRRRQARQDFARVHRG